METYLNADPQAFMAFKKSVPEGPITMLNYLRYKTTVEETGESGKAAYSAYLNAATPFLKKVGAEVLFFGAPKHMVIGPAEEALWDAVLVVKYASITDFIVMVQDKAYPAHLRKRALSDSRLIYCKPIL